MLAQEADAQRIGFAVGYDSPSQFSREYAGMFGAPPPATLPACAARFPAAPKR